MLLLNLENGKNQDVYGFNMHPMIQQQDWMSLI